MKASWNVLAPRAGSLASSRPKLGMRLEVIHINVLASERLEWIALDSFCLAVDALDAVSFGTLATEVAPLLGVVVATGTVDSPLCLV